MIVTVTVNPALDKTAELDELQPGELNRLTNIVIDVGGKGINVSKMIAALGGSSIATGFVGGGSGQEIVDTLDSMDIRNDFVKCDGVTRTNLKVVDKGSRLTELNEPGITVTEDEVSYLVETLLAHSGKDTIFVLSGSLCKGVDSDFYAKLIKLIKENGGQAFLDADSAAFRKAVQAPVQAKPDFIKPNKHEIMEYFGIAGDPDIKQLEELCRRFIDDGIPKIALSLGEDGALFVNENSTLYAHGLSVKAHSTVGAGDSMMGAFAYAIDAKLSWEEAAKLSLAASAGAVTTIGTKPPSRELVDELLGQVYLEAV